MIHDFRHFKCEDFLANESFSNFLLQKDKTDIIFWKEWINNNPDSQLEINKAIDLFFIIRQQKRILSPAYINDEFEKLTSLLDESSKGQMPVVKTEKSFFSIGRMVKVASAVAAVLILGFFIFKFYPANKQPQTFTEIAATASQVRSITLIDGSVIILNTNSSISTTKDYNKVKREIKLTGSAFFKVAKNPQKLFIVNSGSITTTALGTEFYIYQPSLHKVFVSLLSGKVKVDKNSEHIFLTPGDKAYSEDQSFFKEQFNANQLQQFFEGKIVFSKAGMGEIKNVLEEYFNKSVELTGKIPDINFTGTFNSGNIETVLSALKFTYNMQYKISNHRLSLAF